MNLNTLSPASLASAVWTTTIRTLSSLGSGCLAKITGGSGIPTTMPPSTHVSCSPGVGTFWDVTLSITAGAGGSFDIGLTDGTTEVIGYSIAAGQKGLINIKVNTENAFTMMNNDPANSVAVQHSGFMWKT